MSDGGTAVSDGGTIVSDQNPEMSQRIMAA